MKPAIPAALANLAGMVRDDMVPHLTGFRAGNAGMMAAMMDIAAEEWDSAAARLVAENAALRGLLARGAAFLPVPAEGAAATEQDLRISALERENERLRARLIELHAAVETSEDPAARALDAAIWDTLRASVESRRISSANY